MVDFERVRYEKCPLLEVVLQVDFPTILSIDANEPAQFQELIREKYPNYSVQTQNEGQVIFGFDDDNTIINRQSSKKLYTFISSDEKWKLVLAKDVIFLSTIQYNIWEDMAARFVDPLKFFIETYKPAYFSRVGLRYIDSFEKKKLEVESYEWKDLFRPHLLGCLSYETEEKMTVKANILNADIIFEDVSVNVASGIGTADHHDGNPPAEAFILNCDYYSTGKFTVEELSLIAEKLHHRSHSFFRQSITDRLHEAMVPVRI